MAATIIQHCNVCGYPKECKSIGRGRYRKTCIDCLTNGSSECIECHQVLPQSQFKCNSKRCIECNIKYSDSRIAQQSHYICISCGISKSADEFTRGHSPGGLILLRKRCIECTNTNAAISKTVYMRHYMAVSLCNRRREPTQRNRIEQQWKKSYDKLLSIANEPRTNRTYRKMKTLVTKV